MIDNFKLNTSLLDNVDFFNVYNFCENKDNYSTSNKEYQEFIIKFYVEKIIVNYDDELKMSFLGKIFLSYDKNNNLISYNFIIQDKYYFKDVQYLDLEGTVDLYDDKYFLDDINLSESDAIYEINVAKYEVKEFLKENVKNLIIFDK